MICAVTHLAHLLLGVFHRRNPYDEHPALDLPR